MLEAPNIANLVVGADVLYPTIRGFDLYPKEGFLGCTSLLSLIASRQIHDSIFELSTNTLYTSFRNSFSSLIVY